MGGSCYRTLAANIVSNLEYIVNLRYIVKLKMGKIKNRFEKNIMYLCSSKNTDLYQLFQDRIQGNPNFSLPVNRLIIILIKLRLPIASLVSVFNYHSPID